MFWGPFCFWRVHRCSFTYLVQREGWEVCFSCFTHVSICKSKFVLLRFRGLFSLAKFSELSRRRGDKRSSFFIHHLRKDFTQRRQTFRLLVAINWKARSFNHQNSPIYFSLFGCKKYNGLLQSSHNELLLLSTYTHTVFGQHHDHYQFRLLWRGRHLEFKGKSNRCSIWIFTWFNSQIRIFSMSWWEFRGEFSGRLFSLLLSSNRSASRGKHYLLQALHLWWTRLVPIQGSFYLLSIA